MLASKGARGRKGEREEGARYRGEIKKKKENRDLVGWRRQGLVPYGSPRLYWTYQRCPNWADPRHMMEMEPKHREKNLSGWDFAFFAFFPLD